MAVNLQIVCWSHDERSVCLEVNGAKRWVAVEYPNGPDGEAYCEVDGRRHRLPV